MRIGLFLHKVDPLYRINDLISDYSAEIIGYSSPMLLSELPKSLDFQPHPMELLVCCDIALIFSTNDFFWEIPRSALKRGVNVFFADLTAYDLYTLNDFKLIAQEIGVAVGFGFSGEFYGVYEGNSSYFIQVERNLHKECAFSNFRKTIIYDLATLVRFKNSAIKKNRTIALPLNQPEYNLLHSSIETSNGSIFSYTANRLCIENSYNISLYGNGSEGLIKYKNKDTPFSCCDSKNDSTFLPKSFIESIRKGKTPDFSVDCAIETMRLFEEIMQHHSRFI
jgi:hypothetical protein